MSTTKTRAQTLQTQADKANPTDLPDCLRAMRLGRMLTPLKVTVAGAVAAAAFDLTALKVGDGITTVNQGPQMDAGDALFAALSVLNLRVVAGAALAGPRLVGDSGATVTAPAGANALPGVAKISDDGKTITFDANVTGFVIEYIPRSAQDMTSAFGSEL